MKSSRTDRQIEISLVSDDNTAWLYSQRLSSCAQHVHGLLKLHDLLKVRSVLFYLELHHGTRSFILVSGAAFCFFIACLLRSSDRSANGILAVLQVGDAEVVELYFDGGGHAMSAVKVGA